MLIVESSSPEVAAVGFSFQPMLRDWCNKGRGIFYPVCGMVHVKEPLLLIGKSSRGFSLSLSEWSDYMSTPFHGK